jgi:hypothetical protein
MAYTFGDGFDLYATSADSTGYWDINNTNWILTTGRFAGSRAFQATQVNTTQLSKNSSANDTVHHVVLAFQQTAAITGSSSYQYFTLSDGATAQCSVVFRSDGAILLMSGVFNSGTTLATYTGAVPLANTWYAFEFEVIVSNTVGGMRVRKNGSASNDYDSFISVGNLDTAGGTANNYANRLGIGTGSANATSFDDLLWRSDASSVPWAGDIRCYTRMPASDASVQFARTSPLVQTPFAQFTTGNITLGIARYTPFTATYDGTIGTAAVSLNTGYTGNMKCSIFASSGGAPTTVLGSATAITNPITGFNTFTFGTPVPVTKGTAYYIGFDSDTTSGIWNLAIASTGTQSTTSYASFPVASPTLGIAVNAIMCTLTIAVSTNNSVVNEAQQDATTSYVYDSTVGHGDLYGIASIASTPSSVIAVTTRGYAQKSDAGTRNGAVQLKSGAITTPTTWNPSDQVRITLSGGNLIATLNGTTGNGVRSVSSVTSGKYYFEGTMTTWGDSQTAIGIANSTAALASVASTTSNASILLRSGAIWVNGSNSGSSLGARTTGDVICIALDLISGLIWFRVGAAGNWNGSGTASPATGAGGISISAIVSTGIFALYAGNSTAADAVTANFGATSFVGTPPSGYLAGFGTTATGTTVQSTSTVLSTSGWSWLWRTDTVDPATSAAWTAAGVNALQIGPVVVS